MLNCHSVILREAKIEKARNAKKARGGAAQNIILSGSAAGSSSCLSIARPGAYALKEDMLGAAHYTRLLRYEDKANVKVVDASNSAAKAPATGTATSAASSSSQV